MKEQLKKYAEKLLFQMKDEEYETLQSEFEIIEKQMNLISEIKGIEDVEPMTFPFITYEVDFREDEVKNEISTEDALLNAKETKNNQVKVPKVVE